MSSLIPEEYSDGTMICVLVNELLQFEFWSILFCLLIVLPLFKLRRRDWHCYSEEAGSLISLISFMTTAVVGDSALSD